MAADDFDIDSLATYMHMTPAQISRLADRGKIPGRKVGGRWRFSRPEIHHWLEDRIGLSDDEELVQMEGVLQSSAPPGQKRRTSIAKMLPLEAMAVPLEARTRRSVISAMADLAANTGWVWDPKKLAEAVQAREDMHPTALEGGVALLHPRRPMVNILDRPLLALGVVPSGIPFGGSHGSLTDIFFLICSTDDQGHLRALARLSRLIGDPAILTAIRQAPDAKTVRAILVERDTELG